MKGAKKGAAVKSISHAMHGEMVLGTANRDISPPLALIGIKKAAVKSISYAMHGEMVLGTANRCEAITRRSLESVFSITSAVTLLYHQMVKFLLVCFENSKQDFEIIVYVCNVRVCNNRTGIHADQSSDFKK